MELSVYLTIMNMSKNKMIFMTRGSGTGTTTTSTGTRMEILISRESLKCFTGIVDVSPTMVLVWFLCPREFN